MRKLLAIWLGKILTIVGKTVGKKSSSSPGAYALKICPDLVKGLEKCVSKGIIVTCGTNGKTTTNNLMASALEAKGYKVICNKLGANMLSGIATTVLQEMSIFGKLKADYACLEIDEAYTPIVFDYVKPDVMVITNLFRDQLDRYGEIDITSDIIKRAIKKVPNLKLVLNGDDPLCVQFGREENVKAYYYGISERYFRSLTIQRKDVSVLYAVRNRSTITIITVSSAIFIARRAVSSDLRLILKSRMYRSTHR